MEQRHRVWSGVSLAAVLAVLIAATAASLAYAAVSEEGGEQAFQNKCAGCHSIGGGDMAGPDLAGVTAKRDPEWLHEAIEEPDVLLAQGDPVMAELDQKFSAKMPNLGLSDEDVDSIILYMKSPKAAAGAAGPELPPGNAGAGRALFTGSVRMANGGTPCISCHNAGDVGPVGLGPLGGGALAKDITDIYPRFKEAGTASTLRTLQFPLMKDIYGDRPLTDQEVADMVAFFKEVSTSESSATATLLIFLMTGMSGFLILIIISQLVWRKRVHGIRKQLVGGSR